MNKLPHLFLLTATCFTGLLCSAESPIQEKTAPLETPSVVTDELIWGRQIGSSQDDRTESVCVDSHDNVYVVGSTLASITGENAGKNDAFFIKFNGDGDEMFRRQFGTAEDDEGHYIICDEEDNVFVVGSTFGLLGATQEGGRDIFLAKYTADGELLWLKQFGSDQDDQGVHVALDKDGNVYVAGGTTGLMGKEALGKQDGVITKLNSAGEILWNTQFGTPELEYARSIAFDSQGMVYATSSFYMTDISSIVKLSPKTGEILLQKDPTDIKMFGVLINSEDEIFVAGHNKGISMFRKLDEDFDPVWRKAFLQGAWSGEKEIRPYKSNLYATSGCMNWPKCSGFVRIYDGDGNLQQWVMIRKSLDLESEDSTCGNYLTIDSKGAIYHVGGTDENLFGPNHGGKDGFLCKIEL